MSAARLFLAKAAVLLILPAAAAAAAISPALLPALKAIAPLKYQSLLAVRSGSEIRVVATGDSHAAMGFRPATPGVFSLAFPGESLYETGVKLDTLLERLPQVRAVAIQAQPHLFFSHRQASPRAEYQNLRPFIEDPLMSLMQDPCCRGSLPGTALRVALRIPVDGAVPMIEPSGYAFYPKHVPLDFAQQAHHEVQSYGSVVPVPALRRQYEDVIQHLRARGIDVVLTRYPLTAAYRAMLTPGVFAEAEEFFTGLEQRFALKQCGRWDAIQDESLFFNADHLSPEGASFYWETLQHCLLPYVQS